METTYQELYNFWFEEPSIKIGYFTRQMNRWFGGGQEFDLEIKNKFEHLFLELTQGNLEWWLKTKTGTISYIILCDQVARNVYRGSPRAYQYGKLALKTSREIIKLNKDFNYSYAERIFIYLPFEHEESLTEQKISVFKFKKLLSAVPIELKPLFSEIYDYAKRHFLAIKLFGRFPSRNKVLNRISSEEEKAFLLIPKNNF